MYLILLLLGPFVLWGYASQMIRSVRRSQKPINERTDEDHEIIHEGRIIALGAIIWCIFMIWVFGYE